MTKFPTTVTMVVDQNQRWILALTMVCVLTYTEANNVFTWTRIYPLYPSTDRILLNHILEELPKYMVTQCAMSCLKHNKCKSYNYHEKRHTCQLNGATHDDFAEDFSFEKYSHYLMRSAFQIDQGALGLCVSNPCQNNGRCLDTRDDRGEITYQCVCSEDWKGKHCHKTVNPDYWTGWGARTPCSVSCGHGWRSEKRECRDGETHKKIDDVYCDGEAILLKDCSGAPCPRWNNWNPWSECSSSTNCGDGSKQRSRVCSNGGVPGVDLYCSGMENETVPCTSLDCMGPARLLGGNKFGEGLLEIFNDLSLAWGAVCDADWSHSAYDAACRQMGLPGVSHALQDKDYGSPTTGVALMSVRCRGREMSIQACKHDVWNMQTSCPSGSKPIVLQCRVDGQWSLWSEWNQCSVTCGSGDRKRKRKCNHPPSLHGGEDCNGKDEEAMMCLLQPCPVHGEWKHWSTWTQCTATCGGGTRSRHRECSLPKHGGQTCSGKSSDTSTCKTNPCPVDGVWLNWGAWEACDISCGGGTQKRERKCQNPRFNGKPCKGDQKEERQCNVQHCPVAGVWKSWSPWEQCSLPCGVGSQERQRVCDPPKYNGADCVGDKTQSRECNKHPCPVDGYWRQWSVWDPCSVSCGNGTRERRRECVKPKHAGKGCVGDSNQSGNCNVRPCPIDGRLLEWSEWASCSVSCGSGQQSRNRACTAPQYGGKECEGKREEFKDCNEKPCPVDGVWRVWGQWGSCDVTCGAAKKQRHRTCQPPKHDGKPCVGSSVDTELCQLIDCLGTSWDLWSEWGTCSKKCGVGTQTRTRKCIYRGDGKACVGPGNAIKNCNKHPCPVDGKFKQWSEWSACDVTCGRGLRQRKRDCEGPFHGGKDCVGPNTMTDTCKVPQCPVDGTLDNWSVWSACSLTCGNGTVTRQRKCQGRAFGGKDCVGDRKETKPCYVPDTCSVDGKLSAWSTWSSCGVTCGEGNMTRTRNCVGRVHQGKDCDGHKIEYQFCSKQPCPVDGVYAAWSNWSVCSASCGGGNKTKTRGCVGPFHGGKACKGDAVEVLPCNAFSCPPEDGRLTQWSPWSMCDVTCGEGTRTRQRQCAGQTAGGKDCEGVRFQNRTCLQRLCPVDGVLTPWGGWHTCNVSCGRGQAPRYRTCVPPKHNGKKCNGSLEEIKPCNDHECPVDGVLSPWGNWSRCSTVCGGGSHSRDRTCSPPLHGGKDCVGNLTESEPCNIHHCPVDGTFTTWGNWSTCTASCGGGEINRVRVCIEPKYEGKPCEGSVNETVNCNTKPCPVDGVFSTWSAWDICSATCGGGVQNRNRTCDNRAHGGKDCVGGKTDSQSCNIRGCPVDGYFKDWALWDQCTVSCSGGTQTRWRLCVQPIYDGKQCKGPPTETQACNTNNCPVDGVWKKWGQWGDCSTSCGGGTRRRTRFCDGPFYNGTDCRGEKSDNDTCNSNPCPIPGDWMTWSEWTACTVTCGGGIRSRTRECDMTVHGDLTINCVGNDNGKQNCHMFPCRPLATTCTQLRQWGLQDSVMADINPGDTGPLQVYCNMTAEAGVGVTVIGHNCESIMNVTGYEGAGEYQVEVVYNISMKQVIAVIDESESCKQFIQWRCLGALFHNKGERVTYWRNRTGDEADYWGGAEPGSDMCQCGMTASCHEKGKVCNCDSNDGVWREDSGFITKKSELPITGFAAGDTGGIINSNNRNLERGIRILGPLQCFGQSTSAARP